MHISISHIYSCTCILIVDNRKLSLRQRKKLEGVMDEDDIVILESVLALANKGVRGQSIEDIASDGKCHVDVVRSMCLYSECNVYKRLALAVEEDQFDDDVIDVN